MTICKRNHFLCPYEPFMTETFYDPLLCPSLLFFVTIFVIHLFIFSFLLLSFSLYTIHYLFFTYYIFHFIMYTFFIINCFFLPDVQHVIYILVLINPFFPSKYHLSIYGTEAFIAFIT